jgi:hypothetical protein
MSFNFLHRSTRKKRERRWYENALVITVAGSIIVVVGQLAGTIIPIMYGPGDVSDFDIIAEDGHFFSFPANESFYRIFSVRTEDYHPWLRPSRYNVFFRALDLPRGSDIKFVPPERPVGGESLFKLNCSQGLSPGYYFIKIQGIRGDGKVKNTTLLLIAKDLNNPINDSNPINLFPKDR